MVEHGYRDGHGHGDGDGDGELNNYLRMGMK